MILHEDILMIKSQFILNLVLILLLISCSIFEGPEDISNPMDPNDPDYIAPFVTFIQAPANGQIIDTCYVRIEWEGNKPSMNYSFRIDSSNWSEWTNINIAEYPLLDDGNHCFEIKSRYYNGVEGDISDSINFIINDLEGTVLTLSPRKITGLISQAVSFNIATHDVSELAMIKAELYYNPNAIRINAVTISENNSFLLSNGGTIISFCSIDASNGVITIEAGVATGTIPYVSGSGNIATIEIVPLMNQISDIEFTLQSELRTPNNLVIPINDFGNGSVYVE